MRQALHILKKDILWLWGQILLLLVLFALSAEMSTRLPIIARGLTTLLVAGAWIVTAVLVHNEPLTGDRHFWLTRPYSRRSLLATKLAFLVLFISVPSLLADCYALLRSGVPLLPYWSGLLWKQVLTWLCVMLPAIAIASLTRNLKQFLALTAGGYVMILGATRLLWRPEPDWQGSNWVGDSLAVGVVAIASVAMLALQYFRRRTLHSFGIAAASIPLAVAFIGYFPWETTFALQSMTAPRRIQPEEVNIRLGPPSSSGEGFVYLYTIAIPIRIEDPPNTEVQIQQIEGTVDVGGKTWPLLTSRPAKFLLLAPAPRTFQQFISEPATIHGVAHLNVFSNRSTFRSDGPADLRSARYRMLFATASLTKYRVETPARGVIERQFDTQSFAPFPPAEPFLSNPHLGANLNYPNGEFVVETWQIEGHLRKEFTITGIRLADYIANREQAK